MGGAMYKGLKIAQKVLVTCTDPFSECGRLVVRESNEYSPHDSPAYKCTHRCN